MGMKTDPVTHAKVLELCGLGPVAPQPMPPEVSEKEFQARVIAEAESKGWLCYHTHDSRRSQPGFTDLVLVRDRVIFAELKTESGALSKAQKEWRDALLRAGADWFCWRPSDWNTLVEVLK